MLKIRFPVPEPSKWFVLVSCAPAASAATSDIGLDLLLPMRLYLNA